MNDDETTWTPWTTVETDDKAAGGAAPTERRTGTYTDADGRAHRIVEERRPAGAGHAVVSQDQRLTEADSDAA